MAWGGLLVPNALVDVGISWSIMATGSARCFARAWYRLPPSNIALLFGAKRRRWIILIRLSVERNEAFINSCTASWRLAIDSLQLSTQRKTAAACTNMLHSSQAAGHSTLACSFTWRRLRYNQKFAHSYNRMLHYLFQIPFPLSFVYVWSWASYRTIQPMVDSTISFAIEWGHSS